MRTGVGRWGLLGAVLAGLVLAGCGEGVAAEPAQAEGMARASPTGTVSQALEEPLHPQWSRTLRAVSGNAGGVETDASGNVVIAFEYTGPARISGRELPWNGTGDRHVGVARYGSDGTLLWARGFAPAPGGLLRIDALDVSPLGNVFIGGLFNGSVSFGGDTFTGQQRNFVVKFSPGGRHRWSRATSPAAGTSFEFRDFAVNASGNLVALAVQRDVGAPIARDRLMLIGYLGSDGTPDWTRVYARPDATGFVRPRALALDRFGRIYVAGSFQGAVTLGALQPSSDVEAPFLAAFRSRGDPRWARQLSRDGLVNDVACSGTRVAVSFGTSGAVGPVFGGTQYPTGAFVLGYSTGGGERWIRRTGTLAPVYLSMVGGRRWVVMYGAGSADALGAPRFPSGADRWHVGVLRRFDGEPLRLSRFTNPPHGPDATDYQRGVSLTRGGNVYCAGNAFDEQANFGLGPIAPDRDVFLLKLSR